jgi:hypothetical protein
MSIETSLTAREWPLCTHSAVTKAAQMAACQDARAFTGYTRNVIPVGNKLVLPRSGRTAFTLASD